MASAAPPPPPPPGAGLAQPPSWRRKLQDTAKDTEPPRPTPAMNKAALKTARRRYKPSTDVLIYEQDWASTNLVWAVERDDGDRPLVYFMCTAKNGLSVLKVPKARVGNQATIRKKKEEKKKRKEKRKRRKKEE